MISQAMLAGWSRLIVRMSTIERRPTSQTGQAMDKPKPLEVPTSMLLSQATIIYPYIRRRFTLFHIIVGIALQIYTVMA